MRFLEKAKHKLVKKLQGTETTAARHTGHDAAEQQPQIFDSGEADGFYVWPPEVLLSSDQIKPLIIDISVALGGMKENFDKYLMPSILQTALYMQQLPAAESINGEPVRAFGHHVNAGGLLLHSLETCYFALNDSRLAFFNRGVNPAQRDENLNVSRIACALAGLLHDIGKLNDPIVVTYTAENGIKREHVWSCIESIPEFLARVHNFPETADVYKDEAETGRKRPRYYLKGWRKGRSDRHEFIGPFLMRSFLSKATMRLLSVGSNALLMDFMTAIDWRLLPNDYTGVRKNVVFDVWNSADITSSVKDKKLSSLNSLTPLTVNLDIKRSLCSALWQMELKGLLPIDKADLNCYMFTHAAADPGIKFFCLLRFDERSAGFLMKWMREASEINGTDVLQDHAPSRENIYKLLLLCDLLIQSDRPDKLFSCLPAPLKPVEGAAAFNAVCFRSWQDCIDPNGEIYALNEAAYAELTCEFDGSGPEKLLNHAGTASDEAMGKVDHGAVIWENGSAHVADGGRQQAAKERCTEGIHKINSTVKSKTDSELSENSLNHAAEDLEQAESDNDSEDTEHIDINSTVKIDNDKKELSAEQAAQIKEQESTFGASEQDKQEPAESVFPDPANDAAEGSLDQDLPDIVPAGPSAAQLESAPEQTASNAQPGNGETLADFLPGFAPASAASADGTEITAEDQSAFTPFAFGNMPAILALEAAKTAGRQNDQPKEEHAADIRNLDQAAAEFSERRALVDDVLNLNSPDLSGRDPDAEKGDPARLQSKIAQLENSIPDKQFARNLRIMIEARIKGKFSYIDFVTADGRHCYAAFLWNNGVKLNAQAKQLLSALKSHSLLTGLDYGTEQVAKEIYYYGCAQLDLRITEIFTVSGIKPRKLKCREHPYARIEGRPPEARSVVEFLKYRILSLDADETLYGYKARGFAEDAKGRHINAQVLKRCLDDVGATGGSSRIHKLLTCSAQTTPPYLVKEYDDLVLYFVLPDREKPDIQRANS